MAAGGSPTVSDKGKKGPLVAGVPDTAPYPVGGKPAGQFEPGAPSPGAATGRGGGHMNGAVPGGSLRGHMDVSAKLAGISGHAPKRSKGTATGKASSQGELQKKGLTR